MSRKTRMDAMADLLADPAYSVEDVTLLAIVHQEMVNLVNDEVGIALGLAGLQDHGPEWSIAMSIQTGLHESLYGRLSGVLKCEARDEHGHLCTGSVLHDGWHWDGAGCNWPNEGDRDV